MSLWKKVGSFVMVATLLVFGWFGSSIFANANAQLVGDSNTTFENMNNIASTTNEINNPRIVQFIKDISNAAISNNQVILNNSNANLDFDNANLLDITQNNQRYTSITIPVVGQQYSFTSNLTIIFDSNDKITNYSETLITKSDDDKFVITSYSDGELFVNEVTDLDYVSNDELQRQLVELQTFVAENADMVNALGFKETAACIALVAGVDIVVAYLIAGTCAASCPAVPPVCAACIAGVATLGAANIGAIIACFNL